MYETYGPHSPYGHQLDFVTVVTDGIGEDTTGHVRELAEFARADLVGLMKDWEIPFVPFVVALDAERNVTRTGAVTQPDELETLATVGLSLRPVVAQSRSVTLDISYPDPIGGDSREVLKRQEIPRWQGR